MTKRLRMPPAGPKFCQRSEAMLTWLWLEFKYRTHRLWWNERGETTALTNIMLLAVAALVVLGLIFFSNELWTWLKTTWDSVKGGGDKASGPFKG
jgi:hypothetical protein